MFQLAQVLIMDRFGEKNIEAKHFWSGLWQGQLFVKIAECTKKTVDLINYTTALSSLIGGNITYQATGANVYIYFSFFKNQYKSDRKLSKA